MKPENRFIARVHKHIPTVYHLKNHNMYTAGVADVWYSGVKGDLWVEYKWLPKTPKNHIALTGLLTPLQQQWVMERAAEGRIVWIALGHPEGVWALRSDVDGFDAECVKPPGWWTLHTPKDFAGMIHEKTGDRSCFSKLVGK